MSRFQGFRAFGLDSGFLLRLAVLGFGCWVSLLLRFQTSKGFRMFFVFARILGV